MNITHKAMPMEELSPLLLGFISEGYDVTLTVTGNSMRPMLTHKRDSVVLTACDCKKLKKGQIPLYKRKNGQYVLHRIIKVNKETYDIIGDYQTEIEYDVPKQSAICVVKGFYRKGKYHSCDSLGYRIYSFLWMAVRPLRNPCLAVGRFFKKLFKR